MRPFPAKPAKSRETVRRFFSAVKPPCFARSGCPVIDGTKSLSGLSAVSPRALRRPLRVRCLHQHGQNRSGSLAPARNEVARKAVRKGGGGKYGFPDDGWTDGRADERPQVAGVM